MTSRTRSGLLVVVAAAVVVAGCGGVDGANDAVPGTGAPLPGTTTIVTVPLDAPPVGSLVPSPAAVDAPCPESRGGGGGEDMLAESSRLEPMLGQVLAYGAEHPDTFASYGLVWHGSGDASVFVAFSGDLDRHRTALEQVVPFPDELVVCGAAMNEADLRAVEATLLAELAGRFRELGRRTDAVAVVLVPDAADVAPGLVERYGSGVDVSVGLLPWPLESAENVCPPAEPASLPADLQVALAEPEASLRPDERGVISTRVTLTNTGSTQIRFESGVLTAAVVGSAGGVVAPFEGAVAAIGLTIDLAPGVAQDFDVFADTASCDPAIGYRIPPGEYGLVVSLGGYRTPPLPITVG